MIHPQRFLERARLLDEEWAYLQWGGRRVASPWRSRPNPAARTDWGDFVMAEPWSLIERRCGLCQRWLDPEQDFPTDASRPGGVDPRCLQCLRRIRGQAQVEAQV